MMKKYFRQYIEAVTNPLPEMADYFDAENHYLKNYVNLHKTALDVGCGNGRTMKFLAPYADELVGIDIDHRMIVSARKNLQNVHNCKLIEENFLHRRFTKPFDLVFASYNLLGSSEVIVDQGISILEKMVRVTKKGGHTVAAVWSDIGIRFARKYYSSIGIQVKEIKGLQVVTDYGIFMRFSKKDLRRMAKGLGAKQHVISLTPLFYLLDIEK